MFQSQISTCCSFFMIPPTLPKPTDWNTITKCFPPPWLTVWTVLFFVEISLLFFTKHVICLCWRNSIFVSWDQRIDGQKFDFRPNDIYQMLDELLCTWNIEVFFDKFPWKPAWCKVHCNVCRNISIQSFKKRMTNIFGGNIHLNCSLHRWRHLLVLFFVLCGFSFCWYAWIFYNIFNC